MEVTPETARRQAFREATDWLILLQEEPDDRNLQRRFEEWRLARVVNAEAWSATQRTAEIGAAMTPAHADEWRPAVARRRAQALAARRSRRRAIGIGVVATALAACLALVATPYVLLRLQSDHMTGTAELRTFDLPEGSRVTMAPESAIAVAFSGEERRLRLLEGEAFFDVARDPARPFRVLAGTVEVSVLGTSFDVRLDAHGVTVGVQKGVVQVDAQGSRQPVAERLEAGQSLRIASNGGAERSTEPPQVIATWRKGQLSAQDRPLHEVVTQLRRYFPGTIILTDDALGKRTVTGVYNLEDPEEALRGIVQTHGGKVRRITPWMLVVSGS